MAKEFKIRNMTRSEADELVDWAASEGWNPGLHDADLFWGTDPEAFVAAELDGVLIGGGTRLNGFVETAKKQLRLPACLGVNKNVSSVIDRVNEPEFLNALGLVAWGNQALADSGGGFLPGGAVINKTLEKAKKFIQSLIPGGK